MRKKDKEQLPEVEEKQEAGTEETETKEIETKAEEEIEDEDDEEYEDDGGGGKVILIAIIVAVIAAVAGICIYMNLKSTDTATESTAEEDMATSESEATVSEDTGYEAVPTEASVEAYNSTEYNSTEYDSTEYEIGITPTSTPKPIPTATPTPTPAASSSDSYVSVYSDSAEAVDSDDTLTVTTEAAQTVMIGDVRFREMANIASAENCGWVCSSSADYDWFVGDACTGAEPMIGEGTKVFISIGLNDIDRYTDYATAISSKATEWQAKGAEVYFVSVGPVASESGVSNNDICTFNTYMYQNLGLPFIDAYNYLVENGFDSVSEQSTSYTDSTTLILYNYIEQFM